MIAYDNIKIFTCNSNPEFAKTVCSELWVPLGKSTVKTFADGEASVSLEETVRGCDVFLIQSTCKPVNDHLMELLVMILFWLCPSGPQGQEPRSHLRQAGCQHDHRRRR